jgi:hypothetical protein
MAIALDNSTDGGFAGATSLTYAHTTGSGTNRILFVAILTAGGIDTVTSVTYAGSSMTLVNKILSGAGESYLFFLLAPTTGTNNVVITSSVSITIESGCVSYSGAAQVTPEASNTNTGNAVTTLTTTVTTISDNDWTVLSAAANTDGFAAGAGSTLRKTSNGYAIFDSNGVITPPGSKSMTFTSVLGNDAGVIAAFAPFVVSATGNMFLLF